MIAHTGLVSHLGFGLVAIGAVAGYLVAWRSTARPSPIRPASWAAGWVVLLVSTSPMMETIADRSFTGHMVQHLLMIIVVAPLLAFAAPVETVAAAVRRTGTRSRPAERRVRRTWHKLGPLAAPVMFVGVLFVTHLTGIYDRALRVQLVHDLEHVAYVGSAVWLWSVIRGGRTVDAVQRIGSVFAVIAGSALLGVVLLSANSPLIDTYAARLGDADAVSDQRAAASLMWVGGMATSLPLLVIAFWNWASAEERMALRSEQLRSDQFRSARFQSVREQHD